MKVPGFRLSFSPAEIQECLDATYEVLASGMLSGGEQVAKFEMEFAQFVGMDHAVAVSSGGAALEAILTALGIEDAEVIVPTNTFAATAMAVLRAGGRVRLCDVNPATGVPELEDILAARTDETEGVVLVHLGGAIVPAVERIKEFCDQQGWFLVEDCAHAHGARLQDKAAGSFGIAGAYSFFATKPLTTGEGGMVVTQSKSLAAEIRMLKDYGKAQPWISIHHEVGANWHLSELAAAFGRVQLRHFPEKQLERERLALVYAGGLCGSPLLNPVQASGVASWYKFLTVLPNWITRDQFRDELGAGGVKLSGGVYEIPLHQQPAFQQLRSVTWTTYGLPGAKEFCARHVCLPLYPGLTIEEQGYVIQAVNQVLKSYSRNLTQ